MDGLCSCCNVVKQCHGHEEGASKGKTSCNWRPVGLLSLSHTCTLMRLEMNMWPHRPVNSALTAAMAHTTKVAKLLVFMALTLMTLDIPRRCINSFLDFMRVFSQCTYHIIGKMVHVQRSSCTSGGDSQKFGPLDQRGNNCCEERRRG